MLVMVHCDKRGSEVMVGNSSHIFCYEQGTASQIASVFMHNLPDSEDGTFSIDEVRKNIRGTDLHEPITQLVMIEQTHNNAGENNFRRDSSELVKYFSTRRQSPSPRLD